jgi:dTDP-4-amino-4,6-dideoxygalactose transaminase
MPELTAAMAEVLRSGRYVLGDRGRSFEEKFAAYVGVPHAVGVASGTEAIYLALKALGVENGAEVVTTPFTAVPTISAILMAGGRPVFADIAPDTFNINPAGIEAVLSERTAAVLPVHLYGQTADMDPILESAGRRGVPVVEDAAQAHGSLYRGRQAGSMGIAGCFSFYPTKNLGAYGDGGLLTTTDEALAERFRLLRNYGQVSPYETVVNGVNSRLDEMQAALLEIKLARLEEWNERRRRIAALYRELIRIEEITHPVVRPENVPNYHVYVVRARFRDELWRHLESNGVQSNVYYPIPAHLQQANEFLGYRRGDFPEAERASREVLALPMFPELRDDEVAVVARTILEFYGYDG